MMIYTLHKLTKWDIDCLNEIQYVALQNAGTGPTLTAKKGSIVIFIFQ